MGNFNEFFKVKAGEPLLSGDYMIYPLFNVVNPKTAYISLDEALQYGPDSFAILEVSDQGTVNHLKVVNNLNSNVLITDGEQVKGAKQNRTFNVSILIRAKNSVIIPVSCIEGGRWHYGFSRNFEKFRDLDMPSDIRSSKLNEVVNNLETKKYWGHKEHLYMSNQSKLWDIIAQKHRRFMTQSKTGSLTDIIDSIRFRLSGEINKNVKCAEKQTGLIFFNKGNFLGMDYISNEEVFAKNSESLLRSYFLADLDFVKENRFEGGDVIEWLLAHVGKISFKVYPGVDMGQNWMGKNEIVCSILENEGEIVHMTALPV